MLMDAGERDRVGVVAMKEVAILAGCWGEGRRRAKGSSSARQVAAEIGVQLTQQLQSPVLSSVPVVM